jgi:hypothetical protein
LFQQTGNLIIFSPQQVAEPNRRHPVSRVVKKLEGIEKTPLAFPPARPEMPSQRFP